MVCNMDTVLLQERSDMSVFARLKASGYVVAACPQLHPAAQHLLCPCCLQHDLTVMTLCPCCLQHDLTVMTLCPCCLQHDLTVIPLCPCCLCPCCLQHDLTVMPRCSCCVLAVYNMTLLWCCCVLAVCVLAVSDMTLLTVCCHSGCDAAVSLLSVTWPCWQFAAIQGVVPLCPCCLWHDLANSLLPFTVWCHCPQGDPATLPQLAWQFVIIQVSEQDRVIDPVLAFGRDHTIYFYQVICAGPVDIRVSGLQKIQLPYKLLSLAVS